MGIPKLTLDYLGRTQIEQELHNASHSLIDIRRAYEKAALLAAACRVIGRPLRRKRFTEGARKLKRQLVRLVDRINELQAAIDDCEGDVRLLHDVWATMQSVKHDPTITRAVNGTLGVNQHTCGEHSPTKRTRRRRPKQMQVAIDTYDDMTLDEAIHIYTVEVTARLSLTVKDEKTKQDLLDLGVKT